MQEGQAHAMNGLADSLPVQAGGHVGARLAAARQERGWTLAQVAQTLRIRQPYLEAIEQGRVGDLPSAVYAVGFVRAYAKLLDLDPDALGRSFQLETGKAPHQTRLDFPTPVAQRGVPAGAAALVGGVLAIGVYLGWYHLAGHHRPAPQPVAEVPERLAPLAELVTPHANPSPQVASVLPPPSADDPKPPVLPPGGLPSDHPVVAAAADTSAPADAGTDDSTAMAQATVVPLLVPAPVMPAVPPSQAAAAVMSSLVDPLLGPGGERPGEGRIVLRAKADSWIQVRDRDGSLVLLNRILRAGESWTVPAMSGALVMTTGNAGGTEMVVDGATLPSLGAMGAVRRDVALDADALRAGASTSASNAGVNSSSGNPTLNTTTMINNGATNGANAGGSSAPVHPVSASGFAPAAASGASAKENPAPTVSTPHAVSE